MRSDVPHRRATDASRWRRLAAGLRSRAADWRWMLAFAACLLVISVVLANVVVLAGYRIVLDELQDRSASAECTDRLEAAFERRIVLLLDASARDDGAEVVRQRNELLQITSERRLEACYVDPPG